MSGLDFLDLVLKSSDSFILNAPVNSASVFFCLRGLCSVVGFVVLWFPCFVRLAKIRNFLIFSGLKSRPGFKVKTMFSESPPFFVFSIGNYGALKLRLLVVALSESVTMSEPTRTLLNLNKSRLHFLVLVLQISKSFDLISLFFHVLFSLNLTVYGGHFLLLAESLCFPNFFIQGGVSFYFFFVPSFKGFSR